MKWPSFVLMLFYCVCFFACWYSLSSFLWDATSSACVPHFWEGFWYSINARWLHKTADVIVHWGKGKKDSGSRWIQCCNQAYQTGKLSLLVLIVRPRSNVALHMRQTNLQFELIQSGKARLLHQTSNLIDFKSTNMFYPSVSDR